MIILQTWVFAYREKPHPGLVEMSLANQCCHVHRGLIGILKDPHFRVEGHGIQIIQTIQTQYTNNTNNTQNEESERKTGE